jgi:D-xylose transport system substrate-binding protein
MRRVWLWVTASALATGGLTACGAGETVKPTVGVILPESRAALRWEAQDGPYLEAAIKQAEATSKVDNAYGDVDRFRKIADEMIDNGVRVLVVVTIDPVATADVVTKAQARGIPVIEYDRLTAGANASYFVGFDPVDVGRVQAEGLVRCLDDSDASGQVVAEIHGSTADPAVNQGYDSVLAPRYEARELIRGPDDQISPWRGAGFDQMMARTGNRIDAVLAGSDALADGAIAVLRDAGLNGKVSVVGRGATLAGLRNVLSGDQCLTVYLTVRQEAFAAGALAAALARGETIDTGQSVVDSVGRVITAKLIAPRAVARADVAALVKEGVVTEEELCTPALKAACEQAGITS